MTGMWSQAVLPGLALLLFICCGSELVLRRFFKRTILFRRGGSSRRPLTGSAFDEFNLIFNGNKLVEIKQQQRQELQRDEQGDGAPPRTRIDLTNGTALVVLPGEDGASGPRPATDRPSDAEENPSR
ncbi:DUF6191 domain-containing protein [Streptomyces sp. NPDC005931]|uniref:DUF6191 domain-containing protein n=1 Tax=Streptomyces sp. NPDC005931 TaxID=3364737 RepID=UPI003689EDA9